MPSNDCNVDDCGSCGSGGGGNGGGGGIDDASNSQQQLHPCLPVAGATDNAGNEFGKLFIGGLSQLTNEGSLRCHFGTYGQVEDAVVMMDSQTGRSRGFGFVKFRDPAVVEAVLETNDHVIDGKAVDVKQSNINVKGKSSRSLKVFVGGIAPEHDVGTVRACFSQFGHVTDVNLMLDQTKQRHRGFAFVAFDDERVVSRLVQLHYVDICGRLVEVKAMKPPNFDNSAKTHASAAAAAAVAASQYHQQHQQQQQLQQHQYQAQPYHLMQQPHQLQLPTLQPAPMLHHLLHPQQQQQALAQSLPPLQPQMPAHIAYPTTAWSSATAMPCDPSGSGSVCTLAYYPGHQQQQVQQQLMDGSFCAAAPWAHQQQPPPPPPWLPQTLVAWPSLAPPPPPPPPPPPTYIQSIAAWNNGSQSPSHQQQPQSLVSQEDAAYASWLSQAAAGDFDRRESGKQAQQPQSQPSQPQQQQQHQQQPHNQTATQSGPSFVHEM